MASIDNDSRSKPPPPPPAPKPRAAPVAAPATAKPTTRVPAKRFGDEMSSGNSVALRANAARLLGGPAAVSAAPTMANEGLKAAVASGPRSDVAQQDAARADFARLGIARGQPVPADTLMQTLGAHADEPTYQAWFVNALAANNSLQSTVENAWSLENRGAITEAMQAALAVPTLDPQVVQKYAQTSAAWRELGNRLGIDQVSQADQAQASASVSAASSTLQTAQAHLAEADEKLAHQLAALGPALTSQQREQYIHQFQADPRYADDAAAVARASEQLAAILADPTVRQAAIEDRSGDLARAVYQGYQQVTDSPQAGKAIEFAGELMSNPLSPLAVTVRGAAMNSADPAAMKVTLGEQLIAPATARYISQEALEQGGVADKAIDGLETLVEKYQGLQEFYSTGKEWREALEDVRACAKGDYRLLDTLVKDAPSGASATSMALLGVVVSGLGAVDNYQQGKYLEALSDIASSTTDGVKLIAGATRAMADAGKIALQLGPEAVGGAQTVAAFAARAVPFLGVASNVLAGAAHAKSAAEDRSVGLALSATGDFVAAFGSAFPGAGEPFVVVGGALSAIGEVIDDQTKDTRDRQDRQRYLEGMGLSDPLAHSLAFSDGPSLRALSTQLGFDPRQVMTMAVKYPALFAQDATIDIKTIARFAHSFDLSPDDLEHLLTDVLTDSGQVESLMHTLVVPFDDRDGYRSALQVSADRGDVAAQKTLAYLTGENR